MLVKETRAIRVEGTHYGKILVVAEKPNDLLKLSGLGYLVSDKDTFNRALHNTVSLGGRMIYITEVDDTASLKDFCIAVVHLIPDSFLCVTPASVQNVNEVYLKLPSWNLARTVETSVKKFNLAKHPSYQSVIRTIFQIGCVPTLDECLELKRFFGDKQYLGAENKAVVTIKDGTTKIPERLFYSYPMQEIRIPTSVKVIGRGAFENCKNLQKITWYDTVSTASSELKIRESAFAGCSKLKGVKLPKCTVSIGKRAFADIASTQITIPESVNYVGTAAFEGCDRLRKVNWNSSADVKGYTFANCTKLKTFSIKDSVSEIKPYAFKDCIDLVCDFAMQASRISFKAIKGVKGGPDGSLPLFGKTIAVSGDLKRFPEVWTTDVYPRFRERLEKYGGRYTKSITKNVDYLICNDITTGDVKVGDAIRHNVPIISEKEFYKMVGGTF